MSDWVPELPKSKVDAALKQQRAATGATTAAAAERHVKQIRRNDTPTVLSPHQRGVGPGAPPDIFAAVFNNNLDMVKVMLGVGDDAFLTANKRREKDGSCPLHIAAACGYGPMSELLLSAGAAPNLGDHRGYTPLHFAALANHGHVVRILLASGADITKYTTDAQQEEPRAPYELTTDPAIRALLAFRGAERAKPKRRLRAAPRRSKGGGAGRLFLMDGVGLLGVAVAALVVLVGAKLALAPPDAKKKKQKSSNKTAAATDHAAAA